MKKLITISREFGAGGRIVGALVAAKLGVPMYDKELIDLASRESGLSPDIVSSAELRAKSSFSYTLSSAVNFSEGSGGDMMSMNEKLFLTQFDIISQIGKRGEGVIVGRCADYVLRDVPGVMNIFLHAPVEDRVRRCVEKYGTAEKEARKLIQTYDKARRNYYNYHTSQKWGEYVNYDLALNTGSITEEDAADMIIDFGSKMK